MSTDLDRLVRFLPPPQVDVAPPPWHMSRADLGFDFPTDYREFVERYGGGEAAVGNGVVRLHVYAPCAAPGGWAGLSGFPAFVRYQVDEIRPLFAFDGADEDYWGGAVYPIYPDPGGLLAWGDNEDGDIFFWLTEDPDPDKWPVVMWARGPATTFRFEGGMVAFLCAVADGEHEVAEMLAEPGLAWVMRMDWLQRGLNVSAGPAREH